MLLGDCYADIESTTTFSPSPQCIYHKPLNETTLTDKTGCNHLATYYMYKSLIKYPLMLLLIYKHSRMCYN